MKRGVIRDSPPTRVHLPLWTTPEVVTGAICQGAVADSTHDRTRTCTSRYSGGCLCQLGYVGVTVSMKANNPTPTSGRRYRPLYGRGASNPHFWCLRPAPLPIGLRPHVGESHHDPFSPPGIEIHLDRWNPWLVGPKGIEPFCTCVSHRGSRQRTTIRAVCGPSRTGKCVCRAALPSPHRLSQGLTPVATRGLPC